MTYTPMPLYYGVQQHLALTLTRNIWFFCYSNPGFLCSRQRAVGRVPPVAARHGLACTYGSVARACPYKPALPVGSRLKILPNFRSYLHYQLHNYSQ